MSTCFFSCEKAGQEKYSIGFSQCTSISDWRKSMNYSMRIQASVYSNVDLELLDSEDSASKQIEDIEYMIEEGMDVIIVSPLEPNAIKPVIKKAMSAGIPVILLDRKINSPDYTAYVGADNIEVGRNAAEYILSSAGNDSINIVELRGGDGSTPAVERSLGFHQIIDRNKNVHLLKTINDFSEEYLIDTFTKTLDSLQNIPIDYVYCFNDEMAYNAWKIIKEKGRERSIKVIGVDGLNGPGGGIEMVKDGIMEATILYPTGGAEVIKLALSLLNNEQVPKNVVLKTTVIDKFNAGIMQTQLDRIHQQQNEIEHQVANFSRQEELNRSQRRIIYISIGFTLVVIFLLCYGVYSIVVIKKKNRQLNLTNNKVLIQRNQIQKIANQLKKSHQEKIQFFTGVSHELKTPVTLILSAVESMVETSIKTRGYLENEIGLIQKNSKRLLRLINQLLDFRKQEEGKFTVRATEMNLLEFTATIMKTFQGEAVRRNIDFRFRCSEKNVSLFCDANMLEKVYYNLLSNAFKFTPDNGSIELSIATNKKDDCITINFKDSGIGIPHEEMKGVFKPFFKGSNNKKNSSGIGLYLTKEFIGLHKGTIEVHSKNGTTFSISLPKGKAHFTAQQLSNETGHQFLLEEEFPIIKNEMTDGNDIGRNDGNEEVYTVMLIEDNAELSEFIGRKLGKQFNILVSDGLEATDMVFQVIPDIIICDVNLNGDTNGFELSELFKKDLRTSHIPIIILTANSDRESHLQGLGISDMYITKPFSYAILMQSIQSLLKNRELLRYYYTQNLYASLEAGTSGHQERQFLAQINKIIEDNIDSEDFNIEDLAIHLNISRSQLYRKVKALLGVSISEYVSDYRLERAKIMLLKTTLNIGEIAYKNGFSSPNYFSTSFRNKYGMSPNSYRASITIQTDMD